MAVVQARPGFGWPNWTGDLLRMKGWVDGGTELSAERDEEQVTQAYPLHCLDCMGPDAFRQATIVFIPNCFNVALA